MEEKNTKVQCNNCKEFFDAVVEIDEHMYCQKCAQQIIAGNSASTKDIAMSDDERQTQLDTSCDDCQIDDIQDAITMGSKIATIILNIIMFIKKFFKI